LRSARSEKRADRYLILIEGGPPSNYSALSPDVSGCVAAAGPIDHCVTEMPAALVIHMAATRERGDGVPEPTGPGVYVERRIAAT